MANHTSFDLQKILTSPAGPDPKEVRVRFAPSPTGHLHVGGARTHLFNWLHAKRSHGKLVVRIEDTDTVRSTRDSERKVLEDIHSLGLDPDEGVEQGGPCVPYRQSERQPLFQYLAMQLFAQGKAYRCFCTDKVIEEKLSRQKRQVSSPITTEPVLFFPGKKAIAVLLPENLFPFE